MSIVQKVGPPWIRRTIEDYFRLHRSQKNMKKRLTEKFIQYLIRRRKNRITLTQIAKDLGITARYM